MASGSEAEISQPTKSKIFQRTSSIACEKFIHKIRYSAFQKKYPEIYASDAELLEATFQQFKSQLKEKIEEDMDALYFEKKLFIKLTELENLSKEASETEHVKSWRPSGDPNKDIIDHHYHTKLLHKDYLERTLKIYKKRNEDLDKALKENDEEIKRLQDSVLQFIHQKDTELNTLSESFNLNITENLHSLLEE